MNVVQLIRIIAQKSPFLNGLQRLFRMIPLYQSTLFSIAAIISADFGFSQNLLKFIPSRSGIIFATKRAERRPFTYFPMQKHPLDRGLHLRGQRYAISVNAYTVPLASLSAHFPVMENPMVPSMTSLELLRVRIASEISLPPAPFPAAYSILK